MPFARPIMLAFALAVALASCAPAGPTPTPGVEARLLVTVTDAVLVEGSEDVWNVTFIYNEKTVTEPTQAGLDPRDMVGDDVVLYGSIEKDGSFTITKIEPRE